MIPDPSGRLAPALSDRYTIERELGAGGMATVYLAHDVKHDRQVALKVLKPELAAVVGSERFLAEIRTTANLQHPHILPLFDSGQADGFLFFVMPYVEGESLRDRLDREKQLPVEEAVRIATEVADALGHAHAKGVIHRDIKPANILLRDGRVQVADFGIALAVQQAGGARLTETGLSVGTPHYMSPEQATGDRELDGRSDVYSLGCVLYEMLAGEPPHVGPTAQSILAKILTEEPRPLSQLRRSVPAHVGAAVHTALEKLPADRVASASAFAHTLLHPSSTLVKRPGPDRRLSRPFSAVVATIGLLAGGVGGFLAARAWFPLETRRALAMPRQLTFDGTAGMPRLSPDGDFLAYTTTDCPVAEPCRENIKVQDLRGSAPVALDPTGGAGGEGALPVWFNSLDWSPDGLELIYTAAFPDTTLDGVFLIPRLGGSPQRIWAGTAGAAVFRPDGKAVDWISLDEGFGGNAVLRTLFRESGETTARALPLFATALQWSPDGRYLATAGRSLAAAGVTGVFALLDVEGAVRDSASFDMWAWPRLRWTRDGTGLFVTNGQGDLLRIPVDLDSGEIGDVRPVEVERLLAKDYSEFNFDVSGDERTVVFAQVLRSSKLRALERGPTDGVEARTLTTGTSSETFPSLSPDGTLVAYLAQDHLGTNLYVRPFDGGPGRALVQTTGPKRMTTWSPQGDRVAYLSIEPEGDWLSIVPVAGGTPRRLTRAPGQIVAVDWMPDGGRIVFRSEDGAISAVTLGGSVETLLTTPDDPEIQWGTLVSPSGDSVAVIGQDCRGVSCQDYVRVAPLMGGEWREIYSASWNVLKERAQKTWVTNDWTHVSPLGWTEEGIRFVVSRHVGDLAWTNEWLVSPSTMSAVHTADLTEECGAPTIVAMDATGHRRVCIEQRWTSDIWMLEVR